MAWQDGQDDVSGQGLTEDTTVNFDSSMSSAEVQALIDAQPKNLNGYTLTFQFANGAYTLDASLDFSDFYGGNVYILGNSSDSGYGTTKSVHLNFSTLTSGDCISISNVANGRIYYLQITAPDTSNTDAISVQNGGGWMDIRYNMLAGSGKTNSQACIFCAQAAQVYSFQNYVSNMPYGLRASSLGRIFSFDTDDTGTAPNYGINANGGAVVAKQTGGTQPTGTISNEATNSGGVIR